MCKSGNINEFLVLTICRNISSCILTRDKCSVCVAHSVQYKQVV